MRSEIFDSFDRISVLSFLSVLKLAFDTNGVHERAAVWLILLFMKLPTAVALNTGIVLKSKSHDRHQEGALTSYGEAVNQLLETYATEDVIAEANADMMQLTQPSNKLPAECSESLSNTVLRCERVYDEYLVEGIFTEGFSESIHHSTHSY